MLDHDILPSSLDAFGHATLAAVLLAAYLYFGEPFVGVALHRTFERAEQVDRQTRRWLYIRLLILEWGLVALCAATLIMAPGISAASVGLALPGTTLGWTLTGLTVVLGLGVLVLTARAAENMRRLPRNDVVRALGGRPVVAMLPRTTTERRLFGIVAFTAGCAEEFVYRAYFLAFVAAVAPGFPIPVAAAVIVVGFGLAHAYQGPSGIAVTMVFGAVLATLYIVTGSLLAPAILHSLIDLRGIPLGRLLATPARHRRH